MEVIAVIVLCSLSSPSPDEKQDMAESLVKTFPVLQDSSVSGYVCLCFCNSEVMVP